MKTALLVIDVQNYFVKEKAADLPKKIAQHIEREKYDQIIFTKFRNDPASNFHQILNWHGAMSSPDIDLHPDISHLAHGNNTFEKITYSGLKSEGLFEYLKDNDITRLEICGINIDGCVLATAYEAFDLGFDVKILEDLSSTSSFLPEYEDSAKVIIRRNLKEKLPPSQ